MGNPDEVRAESEESGAEFEESACGTGGEHTRKWRRASTESEESGAEAKGSGRGIRLNQLVALGAVLRWEAFSLRRMCSPAVVFA